MEDNEEIRSRDESVREQWWTCIEPEQDNGRVLLFRYPREKAHQPLSSCHTRKEERAAIVASIAKSMRASGEAPRRAAGLAGGPG
ncbi:hypothetical protein V1477_007548 [Vespula maculifrons]|uniref:Uncharacterized protein n=2 Tax=Vespula TaxID=7451 RepID=A0A834JYU9_VESGE|nr:hypothetical protein HZH68_008446 [Vespula germanica]